MRKSLQTRLTIIFIGLAVIPLLLVGTLLTQRSYLSQSQQALVTQDLVAQHIATEVEVFIRARESELHQLVDVYGLPFLDRDRQTDILSSLLANQRLYDDLVLTDRNGQELIHLSWQRLISPDELVSRVGTPEYEEPKANGETYFSTVEFDERTGEPLMRISIPLKDLRSSEFDGVLTAAFRFKTVWDLMAQADVVGSGIVYTIDANNQVVAHPNPSVVLQGTQINLPAENGFTTGLNGNDVALAKESITLGGQKFTVVAERPQSEALALAVNIAVTTAVVTAITIAAAAALGVLAAQQITRPIDALAETAQAISKGNLNEDVTTITTTREDEIGTLARAFARMTTQLRELIGGLEQRVAERTQALATSAQVSQQLSTILEPTQLVSEVVQQIQTAFNYYHVHIYLFDADAEYLVMAGGTGNAGQELLRQKHKVSKNQGLVGQAATTRTAVFVPDVSQDKNWLPNKLLPDTRSELAVPIATGKNVLGVLDVQHNVVGELNQDSIELLQSIANQIAIALQNARQVEETTQSQQLLRTLIDNIPNPIFYKNMKGAYLGYNQAFLDYLGLPEADVQGKTVYDSYADKDLADKYYKADQDLLDNPGTQVYEADVQYADGTIHNILFNKATFTNPDGSLGGLVGTMVDITDRKASEEALREAQTRTQTILEAVTVPLIISHAGDGKIYYANEYLAEVVQVPIETLMTQGTPNFYEDMADRTTVITQIRQQGFVNNYELRLKRSDGQGFWALLSARLITFAGEPAIITSLIDITDRKAAEEIVGKQATELQTVAQVSTTAATALDQEKLLQNVTDLAKERFNLYHVHIYLLDAAGENLVLTAGAGEVGQAMVDEGRIIPLSQEQSLVAQAARNQQGVIVHDVRTDPNFLPHPFLPDTRSEMAVPMIAGKEVLGVLDVQSDVVARFSDQDVQIQTTLAAQIAVSLRNARLYEQTQQALEDAKTFRQLVAASGQGIGMADLQGVVTYANPALLKMISVEKPEEMLGQPMFPLYPPEIQKRLLDEIIPIVLQQEHWQGEMQILSNGRIIPTFEEYFLLFDEKGNPARFASVISDMTERKQAEETLRERELLLHTVTDATPDWIFVKDINHRYILVNQGYADSLHMAPADFIGKNDLDIGFPEEIVKGNPEKGIRGFWADDLEIIRSGEMKIIDEEPAIVDGEPRVLNTIKVPLKDDEGQVIAIVGFVHDITTQKEAQLVQEKLARELQERLEQVNALQRAMTREGWETFLTASERSVSGFAFSDETIRPLQGASLTDQIAPNIPIRLEDITNETFDTEHTAVSLPLTIHGESIGVIGARTATGQPLSSEQQALFTAMSQQVAEALERARLFEETEVGRQQLDRRAQELAAINEVAQSVSRQLDPEQLLQTIYRQVQSVLPADAFIVAQYDALNNIVSYPMVYDNGKRYYDTPGAPRPGSLIWKVLQSGEPGILNRTPEQVKAIIEEKKIITPATLGDTDQISASLLYVPLQTGQQIVGALSIQSYSYNAYGPREVSLLIGIGNHLAVALENARLYAEAQRRAEQMALINQLAETVAQQLDPQQVLETVYQQVQDVISTDAFIVGLQDTQTGLVHYPMVYDQGKHFEEEPAPPKPGSYMEQILQDGQPILVNYTPEELEKFDQESFSSLGSDRHPSSLMFVPLYSGTQIIGAISLQNYRGHQYTKSDIQLLSGIANHVTVALENARLFTQTEQTLAETALLYDIGSKLNQAKGFMDLVNAVAPALETRYGPASVALLKFTLDEQKYPYLATIVASNSDYSDNSRPQQFNLKQFPLAQLWIQSTEPLLISDIDTDQRIDAGVRAVYRQTNSKSGALLPLRLGDTWVGLFTLTWNETAVTFTEADERLFRSIATQMAISMNSLVLLTETEARARREQTLREIGSQISASVDAETVLRTAVRTMGRALGLETFVYLDNPETDDLAATPTNGQAANA